MPRELLSIRKMSDTSNGYYLMQGQDRIAVIVPLSQHVYGPEIVGDLLSAMCELTNDAQDEFETPRIKPAKEESVNATPLCDSCGHIAHAYDCLGVTLDRQELGNCKCYIDPQDVERYCPYCLAGLCANEAFEPEPDDPRTVMIVVPDQCQHTHHDLAEESVNATHPHNETTANAGGLPNTPANHRERFPLCKYPDTCTTW